MDGERLIITMFKCINSPSAIIVNESVRMIALRRQIPQLVIRISEYVRD